MSRAFVESLPFELTAHQSKALEELDADLARTIPMRRLLQGDVGSGKTVVALYCLVRAAEATGAFGVVLLAPATASTRWRLETELLRLQQNFSAGGPSQLRLTLRAVLVDSSSRAVLASREFDTSLPAASEDAAGGAAAAQRAALQVARQLAQFCAQAVGRAGG